MATVQSAIVMSNEYCGEDAIKFRRYLAENDCPAVVTMASFWVVSLSPNLNTQSILQYIQSEALPLQVYE